MSQEAGGAAATAGPGKAGRPRSPHGSPETEARRVYERERYARLADRLRQQKLDSYHRRRANGTFKRPPQSPQAQRAKYERRRMAVLIYSQFCYLLKLDEFGRTPRPKAR